MNGNYGLLFLDDQNIHYEFSLWQKTVLAIIIKRKIVSYMNAFLIKHPKNVRDTFDYIGLLGAWAWMESTFSLSHTSAYTHTDDCI